MHIEDYLIRIEISSKSVWMKFCRTHIKWEEDSLQLKVRMALGEILRPLNCHVLYILKYNKILFFSLKINKI
jgi:hypothetical protein